MKTIKYKAYSGGDGTWGVSSGNAILYDAMFSKSVAERLSQLENSKTPPKDWSAAETILKKEGLIK